jgi:RNA polymerase sigma factor for flagellar operon FliA
MLDHSEGQQLEQVTQGWWHAWRDHGDQKARQRLLLHYGRFARIMAAKLYGQHPYKVLEFDDYVQYAQLGLMEAMERYDPDAGAMFETYSASRIRGAILDGIRKSSDIQEQISARRSLAAERVASLNADAPQAGVDSLFAHLAGMAIGLAVGFALEGTGMFQGDEAGGEDAYQGIELAQLGKRVRMLTRGLPDAQSDVIVGHYLQQQSFTEIAVRLGLSRGRVAQLHKEALQRLKELLQRQGITGLSY